MPGKGDVMTRISNDVQEIEVSVMSSLTMIFRDPILIIVFVVYLFVTSYELTLFALVLLPCERVADRTGQPDIAIIFIARTAKSWASFLRLWKRLLPDLRIVKGFNAEEKMKAQFADANEKYSKVFRRVIRKAYLASPLSEFLSTMVIMVLMYVGGNLVLSGSGRMSPEESYCLSCCLFTDNPACKKYNHCIFCNSERNGFN